MPSIGLNAQKKIERAADMLTVGVIKCGSQLEKLGIRVKKGVPLFLSDIVGLRERYIKDNEISEGNLRIHLDAMANWIEEELYQLVSVSIGNEEDVSLPSDGLQVPLGNVGRLIDGFTHCDFPYN